MRTTLLFLVFLSGCSGDAPANEGGADAGDDLAAAPTDFAQLDAPLSSSSDLATQDLSQTVALDLATTSAQDLASTASPDLAATQTLWCNVNGVVTTFGDQYLLCYLNTATGKFVVSGFNADNSSLNLTFPYNSSTAPFNCDAPGTGTNTYVSYTAAGSISSQVTYATGGSCTVGSLTLAPVGQLVHGTFQAVVSDGTNTTSLQICYFNIARTADL